MDIRAIAERAADWWVDAVSGGRRGTSGDVVIDMMYARATKRSEPPGDVERFREALIRETVSALNRCDSVFLSTDYSPEGRLADAARVAGLRAAFPMKTLMHVDRDGVTVSCGYRAPTVRVCGDAIWSVRLYARDYGDVFTAYRGTVESDARSTHRAALDAVSVAKRGAVTLERDGYALEERCYRP